MKKLERELWDLILVLQCAMDNDAFRNLLGLGGVGSTPSGGGPPTALPAMPATSWPELLRYDGRMAARAIKHDRPDVRVITVTEYELNVHYSEVIDAQFELDEDEWLGLAAPLTEDERRTMELVVLLCVRPCQHARDHDNMVVALPFVLRRPLLEPAATVKGLRDLPEDELLLVLSCMPPLSVLRMACTSKKFLAIADSPALLPRMKIGAMYKDHSRGVVSSLVSLRIHLATARFAPGQQGFALSEDRRLARRVLPIGFLSLVADGCLPHGSSFTMRLCPLEAASDTMYLVSVGVMGQWHPRDTSVATADEPDTMELLLCSDPNNPLQVHHSCPDRICSRVPRSYGPSCGLRKGDEVEVTFDHTGDVRFSVNGTSYGVAFRSIGYQLVWPTARVYFPNSVEMVGEPRYFGEPTVE